MSSKNPYAIEERTASESEDNLSVKSTKTGDNNVRDHTFWTKIQYTKLVKACEEIQEYVDNKSWKNITGENVIEDTVEEFENARKAFLVLSLKAIAVLNAADDVRNNAQNWEELYEYNDNGYDSGDDNIGIQDHQLSWMIKNAKRMHDLAQKILGIADIHESEANLHYIWTSFHNVKNDDVMSDEFVQACNKRRENLRTIRRQEKIDRGEDPDADTCAIQ